MFLNLAGKSSANFEQCRRHHVGILGVDEIIKKSEKRCTTHGDYIRTIHGDYTRTIYGGLHMMDYTRWSTYGGVYTVDTWWTTTNIIMWL